MHSTSKAPLACASVLLLVGMGACQPSGSSSPPASLEPSASLIASEPAAALTGRIVFGRWDPAVGDFVVYLIDPNGIGETQLVPGGHECPRWSPDGKSIVMTPPGIVTNAGQPNAAYQAFTFPDPKLTLGCAIWSADGNRLAYEGWDETDPSRNGIYTSNADGGDVRRLTSSPNGSHDVPGDYSADGSQLYFGRDGEIMVVGMDDADPRKVGTGGLPSLSPDGQTLVAVSHDNLELIAIDESSVTPITILGLAFGVASWSPDGSWIVFTLGSNDLGDIARVRPDGSGLFVITHDPANEEFADWAP